MALPKINTPKTEIEIPTTGEIKTFRPFVVGEQKLLLIAMKSESKKEILNALIQVVDNCCVNPEKGFKAGDLAIVDLEYVFLKLRSISVGEIIEAPLKCSKCDMINDNIEINISNIKPHFNENHKTKIEVTDNIGIIMRYPTVEMFKKYNTDDDKDSKGSDVNSNDVEDNFNIILDCVDRVYDGDKVYTRKDFTREELEEFINGLYNVLDKFKDFFDTMPQIKETIEFNCMHCEEKNKYELRHLEDFFG